MIHDTQSAQISQKQDRRNIYAIMKTMCPPGYHYNGFVATHALGHMIYGYTLLVPMNQRVLNKLCPSCTSCAQVHEFPQCHCGDNWEGTLFSWLHIYIYIYMYIYIFLSSLSCLLIYFYYFFQSIPMLCLLIFQNFVKSSWFFQSSSFFRYVRVKSLVKFCHPVSFYHNLC